MYVVDFHPDRFGIVRRGLAANRQRPNELGESGALTLDVLRGEREERHPAHHRFSEQECERLAATV